MSPAASRTPLYDRLSPPGRSQGSRLLRSPNSGSRSTFSSSTTRCPLPTHLAMMHPGSVPLHTYCHSHHPVAPPPPALINPDPVNPLPLEGLPAEHCAGLEGAQARSQWFSKRSADWACALPVEWFPESRSCRSSPSSSPINSSSKRSWRSMPEGPGPDTGPPKVTPPRSTRQQPVPPLHLPQEEDVTSVDPVAVGMG